MPSPPPSTCLHVCLDQHGVPHRHHGPSPCLSPSPAETPSKVPTDYGTRGRRGQGWGHPAVSLQAGSCPSLGSLTFLTKLGEDSSQRRRLGGKAPFLLQGPDRRGLESRAQGSSLGLEVWHQEARGPAGRPFLVWGHWALEQVRGKPSTSAPGLLPPSPLSRPWAEIKSALMGGGSQVLPGSRGIGRWPGPWPAYSCLLVSPFWWLRHQTFSCWGARPEAQGPQW